MLIILLFLRVTMWSIAMVAHVKGVDMRIKRNELLF